METSPDVVLLTGGTDGGNAEALITAADRAQHIAHVVRPALAAGRSVVSDRSVYSTLGYQGYGRGLDLDELRHINDWAITGLWPHHVVLLDAPTEVLATRLRDRQLDRFELAGDDFHERVAAGFRKMAANDPEHWTVVDADGDAATVARRVRAAIDPLLAR
jgi:dTMP kinase